MNWRLQVSVSARKYHVIALCMVEPSPDEQRIMEALSTLRPESTACPGAVSRKLWPDEPTPERMTWMRTVCAALCERGLLRITQRGVPVSCSGYRGPIRIALTDQGRALMRSRE